MKAEGSSLHPFFLSARSLSSFEKVEEIVRIFFPDLERTKVFFLSTVNGAFFFLMNLEALFFFL